MPTRQTRPLPAGLTYTIHFTGNRRALVNRIIIVGAVIAAVLWLGPLSVPNWAVIGFVLAVLFPLAVILTVKRLRLESRLARTLWLALTGKCVSFWLYSAQN
jgi:hypothetical protein